MLSKRFSFFVLFLIFVIALILRVYKLDSIPYGFHVDEVKVGWNAYSILKSGKDDKGNFMPLYYDSFGDFRPTGLIYLTIPSIAILGNTVFAVRFPFALIGALTTIAIYLLTGIIFNKEDSKLSLVSATMIAFNPWHIITSRATSESIVAVFLTILGIYFFLNIFKKNNFRNLFLSSSFLILAYYFYHNVRVLIPIFLFIIIFFYYFILERKIKIKQILVFLIVTSVAAVIFLSPESRARASQVSLKSDFNVLYEITKMPAEAGSGHVLMARTFHNKYASYSRRFMEEYREYFSSSFLLGDVGKPIRYSVPYVGLFTYIEIFLVISGIFFVSQKKTLLLIFSLLLASPIVAALTIEDTPNIQRSILMIPFMVIIAALGYFEVSKLQHKWEKMSYLITILYFLNFVYFAHMYLVHQKMSIAAYYRNGGNIELINKLNLIGNNYDKIVISNSPDSLYPWYGFLNKLEVSDFSELDKNIKIYKNIVFSSDKCPLSEYFIRGEKIDSILFVDAEGCEINQKLKLKHKVKLIDTIFRPDSSPPYYLRIIESGKK